MIIKTLKMSHESEIDETFAHYLPGKFMGFSVKKDNFAVLRRID